MDGDWLVGCVMKNLIYLQLWGECECALTIYIQAKSQKILEAYFQHQYKIVLFSDTKVIISVFPEKILQV